LDKKFDIDRGISADAVLETSEMAEELLRRLLLVTLLPIYNEHDGARVESRRSSGRLLDSFSTKAALTLNIYHKYFLKIRSLRLRAQKYLHPVARPGVHTGTEEIAVLGPDRTFQDRSRAQRVQCHEKLGDQSETSRATAIPIAMLATRP
jgi:hypothetical protein